MRTFMNRLGSLKNKLLNLKRPAVRTGRRRTAASTLFLIPALLSASLLSGCHGQREQAAFTVPEEFDTSRNYEITFWAKMIPTSGRPTSTNRPSRIFRSCIPTSPSTCVCIRITEKYTTT